MNEAIALLLDEKPLIHFSINTAVQVDILYRKANKLTQISSSWDGDDSNSLNEYYDEFWFWILGAYEVVRVISANRRCFSAEVLDRANNVKIMIAELRMPFAKQEFRGRKVFSGDAALVDGIEKGLRFKVRGNSIHSQPLIEETLAFFSSIERKDILAPLKIEDP